MKKQFILFLSIIILTTINCTMLWAQCTNVGLSLNSTPSTCQSNGTIGITVTGADAPNLRMSDAEYKIDPVSPSSYARLWAQEPSGTLTGVPPGTYTVSMRAYCTTSGSWTVHASSGNVAVASSYTLPEVQFGTMRKPLNCPSNPFSTGRIPIIVRNGKTPIVITMTAYPSAYSGPTSYTINTLAGTPPSGSYTFDNLPAGTYTFSVQDNCSYNTTLSTNLQAVSANAVSAFVYTYPYMPSSIVQNDCQSVRVNVKYNASGNANEDTYEYYYTNGATYYEIALNEDQTTQPISGWTALTSGTTEQYINYSLSVPYNTFKAQNKHVAVWGRLKGTSCVFLIRAVSLYTSGNPMNVTYSNVTCSSFTVTHYPSSGSLYSFCFPYQWQITQGASTLVPWSSAITGTTNQVVNNVPYGCSLHYKDASGQTYTRALMSDSPMSNISIFCTTDYCLSNSQQPLPASGLFSNYIWIYNSNNFPIGTRIEYLSGPVGASPPAFSDITTTSAITSVNLYASGSNYTSSPAPYLLNVPGTYSFRITLPTCPSATVSVAATLARIVTPQSYTILIDDCNGLTIKPSGQIGTVNSSGSTATITTYFSIDTAPAGAIVNKTAVTSSGSLVLPVSGTYTIKMMSSSGTGTCAASTMQINYTKKQLQLNVAVTSAYVCSGLSVGNIRIQGMNGIGPYTYQLWSSDLTTLHLTNSAGTFSYGTAGQSFIVRVIDNGCATSFDQLVTILDLSSAQIVYSGSQNNEFCEGGAIQLNCVTLGQTSYTWSGPNGYTSTAQNPTIPNATPAMSGSYTVTVAPENCGLPMVQTIVIKVNPQPPLPTVPNTAASFCLNATAQTIAAITGASATSGSYAVRYYNSSGSSITPATTVPTSAATVLTYYVVQYNTSTGCESDQVEVTVSIYGTPAAPTVNPVSSMCPNTTFNITVSPVTSGYYYKVYSVSLGGTAIGQSAVSSGTISGLVAPAGAASYYVSAVNAGGCESPRTAVSIPILATATPANITVPGAQVCTGTSATLTATSGLSSPTFYWYTSQTATTPFNTGATYVTPSSLTTSTTYYIGVSNAANCENAINNRQTVTVTVNALPTVSASAGVSTICQGTATTFTATAGGGTTPSMTYTWVIAGATYTGTSNTYVHSLSTTSTYSVSVKNANGCVSTTTSPQTVTVTATVSPSSTITESVNDICSGTSVNFTSVISGGGVSPSYQWKVNGTNVGTGDTFYTYEPEHNDVVTCVLTSSSSCASPNPVTSNSITMRVTPSVTPSLNITGIPD